MNLSRKKSAEMYREIVFVVLLIFNVVKKTDAFTSRVVGGQEAPLQFGRFHVSLQNITGHHVCGGSVISKKHILTAAHCIYGADPQYIKAVVGTTNLDAGGQTFDIWSIKLHHGYNTTVRQNDIAVLKIKGQFDLQHVEILSLYEKEILEGDILILSGFGAHTANGESSRQLYSLVLPVFSQETCEYAMRYSRNVTETMFCTFTRVGEGTCHGDSGGPLVRHNKLVGVASWGIPCAVGFPDVHTRITPFINWIRDQMKYSNCHA